MIRHTKVYSLSSWTKVNAERYMAHKFVMKKHELESRHNNYRSCIFKGCWHWGPARSSSRYLFVHCIAIVLKQNKKRLEETELESFSALGNVWWKASKCNLKGSSSVEELVPWCRLQEHWLGLNKKAWSYEGDDRHPKLPSSSCFLLLLQPKNKKFTALRASPNIRVFKTAVVKIS